MMTTPVRVSVTRWVGILLTAIALFNPWATEVAAQEPLDSVIPIDSLVVSVLRVTEGLGRAPYAVSVQSGRALQLGNVGFSLDEALQGVPGLQIQNRYNYSVGERISIRGFGSRAQFGARGIKVFVDGVPATLADGQTTLDHLDIGSMGRAEVMRGPSAAMYGNGGGGVLSLQTKEAPLVPIQEEATAIFGQNGLMRFQSTTSGTTGGVSYLLNVAHLTYDGFRTVSDSTEFVEERSDSSLYGLATRLNVNAQVGMDAGAGQLLFTGNFMDLAAESAGGMNRTAMYTDSTLHARSGGFGNVARNARKDVYQGQLGATWSLPIGGVNAQFVGWGLFRRMDNPIPPRIIDLDRDAFGLRAMVSSDTDASGPITWAAGFDLDFQRDDRVESTNDGGSRGAVTKDQFETVNAGGVFVQAGAELGQSATLQAGLRYNRFDFNADDRLLTDGDDSGGQVMDQLSPTVGLVVRASPDLSIFGNFSTSLATPTTTELANNPDGSGGFNPDLNPQTGNTGEAGLRGQANSIFGYETSVFYSKLQNELVAFEDAAQPGRVFFENSGESTYKGLEASIRAAFPSGLFGQLQYTLVDAKFDEFVSVDGDDYAGNVVPGAAKHRFEGLVRMSRSVWYVELRGDHVGKVRTNNANDSQSNAKSYTLWDARIGLSGGRTGSVAWAPFISFTNILDEVYSAAVAINAFGPPGGERYYEPGPRRAFSAGVTATF